MNPNEPVCGFPALEVHYFLQAVGDGMSLKSAQDVIGRPPKETKKYLRHLVRGELLRRKAGVGDTPIWKLTDLGRTFLEWGIPRPLKRREARQAIDRLLRKVEAINLDDELSGRIRELRLKGVLVHSPGDEVPYVSIGLKLVGEKAEAPKRERAKRQEIVDRLLEGETNVLISSP